MNFKETFKYTYHSFNPFRAGFEHGAESRYERGQFSSGQGRVYCLKKLGLSLFTVPLKIIRKILRVAEAVFYLLGEIVHPKENYLGCLGGAGIYVADRLASLAFSPLNIVVGRIRYVIGLIHPGVVFTQY